MRQYDGVQINLGTMGKTGFRLLTKQKRILVNFQAALTNGQVLLSIVRPKDPITGVLTPKQINETIEGLLNLLDRIQDQAVDSGQVPESVVFPFKSKE